jgi:hypothetical protein
VFKNVIRTNEVSSSDAQGSVISIRNEDNFVSGCFVTFEFCQFKNCSVKEVDGGVIVYVE